MILVNAANGQQGKLLVPKLIAAGLEVRGCVRSESSAAELREAGVVDVIVGDIAELDVIARAIRGVEKIYHISPGINPRERELGLAWIDASRAEGVRHFVFSSVLHPIISDLVQHEIKRGLEEYLISSGLEFTILQPTIYMAPRRFRAGDRERRAARRMVARSRAILGRHRRRHRCCGHGADGQREPRGRDLRVGGARALYGPRHGCDHVGGSGTPDPGGGDRRRHLSQRPVRRSRPEPVPHEATVGRSLRARYSSHDFLGNPNVLTWLLGREPTTFRRFIMAQAARHA